MTDIVERLNDSLSAGYSELRKEAAVEIMRLRAKIAEMEQQEPVGVLHVGSYYGEELQDWEFEANQCACDKLNEAYVRNPMSLPLYALPGAQTQPAPKWVDGWREGVESAARLIDQKAELYAIRFGRDDIGGLSFGQGPHAEIKIDHYTSMIELADEVRAMLAARARMSVPEGWKLVPIEPTPTMVKAGLESSHVLNVHRVLACYDAMIDAAQSALSLPDGWQLVLIEPIDETLKAALEAKP